MVFYFTSARFHINFFMLQNENAGGMSTELADDIFSQDVTKKLIKDGALKAPSEVAKGMVMAVARYCFLFCLIKSSVNFRV